MSRRESRWFAQVFPGVLPLFPSCPGQPLPTPHDELVILVKENIKLLPGCLDEIVPPPHCGGSRNQSSSSSYPLDVGPSHWGQTRLV
jgi:hypothetical protein